MEIIHIVLGKANPQRMNGVNKVVYQLATRQAEAGRNVSVWGISKSIEHNYGERKFRTILFKASGNPFRIDVNLENALKGKKGLAVFHLHGGWIPTFSTIADVLQNEGIPFVFTPHGAYNTVAMKRSGYLKKIYFHVFEKELLRKASKVHCIGESEVTGLHDIFETEKTVLLPYGFEIPKHATSRFQVAKSKKLIVGFVGRLDVYTKGLDLLLDAFKEFHGFHPLSALWIVGDGPERQQFERRVLGKSMESSVILWGSKFGDEKDKLMAQMDVFVHPSRNEGLPMSVLEAASMGMPCIVSEATNVGSYVKKYGAGQVVRNENTNDLVNAFEDMYLLKTTSQLDEVGARAKQMVQEVFDWTTILKGFDSLYNNS